MSFPCLIVAFIVIAFEVLGAELRVGIIGCDTSHVPAFTEILNNPRAKDHISGARVVAAFKGGSKDIESSWSRVEGYSKTLQEKYGVRIYESIEQLCGDVDAVLLESLDGRPHLQQATPVIKAGKPLYIDKPMAASVGDVIEIFNLARQARVPVFSSSSLRYGNDTQAAVRGALGKIMYAETSSPCEIEAHHPDLFWYGVHGIEALFAVMGTGCQSVERGTTPDGKIEVTGLWTGGRKGIYRENNNGYMGIARGEKGEAKVGSYDGYAPLVVQIVKFFQTGVTPVPAEETIELFAFMQAADESKAQGGKPVKIKSVLKEAYR